MGMLAAYTTAAERGAQLTCRITTNQGRTDERSRRFIVIDR